MTIFLLVKQDGTDGPWCIEAAYDTYDACVKRITRISRQWTLGSQFRNSWYFTNGIEFTICEKELRRAK